MPGGGEKECGRDYIPRLGCLQTAELSAEGSQGSAVGGGRTVSCRPCPARDPTRPHPIWHPTWRVRAMTPEPVTLLRPILIALFSTRPPSSLSQFLSLAAVGLV